MPSVQYTGRVQRLLDRILPSATERILEVEQTWEHVAIIYEIARSQQQRPLVGTSIKLEGHPGEYLLPVMLSTEQKERLLRKEIIFEEFWNPPGYRLVGDGLTVEVIYRERPSPGPKV